MKIFNLNLRYFTLLVPFVVILFIAGCSKPAPKYESKIVSGKEIISLIDNYINGDERAEAKLKDPFEFNILDAKYYRKTEIDSLKIDGKTYFAVTMQHKNAAFNKFLIYNDTLGLLLHDKNVPGSLSYKRLFVGEKEFFAILQKFSVKSIVNVEYLKIYDIKDEKATLLFENYTEVSSPAFLGKMSFNAAKGQPATLTFKLYGNKSEFKPLKIEYNEKGEFSTKATKWQELLSSYLAGFETNEKITDITEELPKYYNTRFDLMRMYLPEKWEIKNGIEIKSLFKEKVTGTVATRAKKDIQVFIFDLEKNSPVRVYLKDINFTLLSNEFNYSLFSSKLIKQEDEVIQHLLVKCENEECLVTIKCSESFYNNNYPLVYYMINSVNLNCFQ